MWSTTIFSIPTSGLGISSEVGVGKNGIKADYTALTESCSELTCRRACGRFLLCILENVKGRILETTSRRWCHRCNNWVCSLFYVKGTKHFIIKWVKWVVQYYWIFIRIKKNSKCFLFSLLHNLLLFFFLHADYNFNWPSLWLCRHILKHLLSQCVSRLHEVPKPSWMGNFPFLTSLCVALTPFTPPTFHSLE